MFVVFLPALNFRGNRSPYLWWFHKLFSNLGDEAGYICGDEYFRDPAELLAAGRTEAKASLADLYQYRVPDPDSLTKQLRVDIPLQVWQALEARYPANPLAAFRHYCLQEDDELRAAIDAALNKFSAQAGPPEAVITCVNCSTLQSLCRSRSLPLIHLELGPLRQPTFLQTAYFDFSGVNGGTEAQWRFIAAGTLGIADKYANVDQLRSLFTTQRLPDNREPEADLGLSLQIEDDSNILCYANGHSSLSLINSARYALAEGKIAPPVMVRPHPGSYFSLRTLPGGLEIDRSATSVDFALRCRKLHTINSGLAVESMLLGRPAIVRGDSPFTFCTDSESGNGDVLALSFFLLNYLVPWRLAFKTDYIRWRLRKPTEREIRQLHLESFMQEKIRLLEIRISELEHSLAERDRQLADIKSSFVWRLTFPLRAIPKLIRRLFCAQR